MAPTRRLTKRANRRKNRSIIWELMVRTSVNKLQCNVCQKVFLYDGTGNTSNMIRHCRINHPSEYARLTEKKESTFERQVDSTIDCDSAEEEEDCNDVNSTQFGSAHSSKGRENLAVTRHSPKDREKIHKSRTFNRKNVSIVWTFLQKINPQDARCRLCQKLFTYGGSTTNMRKHLLGKHIEEFLEVQRGGTLKFPGVPQETEMGEGTNEFEGGEEERLSDTEHADLLRETSSLADETYTPSDTEANFPEQCLSANVKRQRKNPSVIWNFMTRLDKGSVMCQLCNKTFCFDGSTSNMIRHLKVEHLEEYEEGGHSRTEELAVVKQEEPQTGIPSNQNRNIHSHSTRKPHGFYNPKRHFIGKKISVNWKYMDRNRSPPRNGHMQNSSSGLNSMSSVSAKLRMCKGVGLDELVLMAVGNLSPCSLDLILSENFLAFMRRKDSRFVAHDKKTMEDRISEMHREGLSLLQNQIAGTPGIAVSLEIWTFRQRQKYMTVTVNFVTDDWEIQSRVLKTALLESFEEVSHCIAHKLEKVLQELDILDKVKCVIGDDSDLLYTAASKLNMPFLPCLARSLDKIIWEALKASGDFEYLVNKVKKVAGYFLHSTEAAQKLSETCTDIDPPQFALCAESDWIGTFKMLQCYLKSHSMLKQILDEIQMEDFLLTPVEIEVVSRYVQVLEPFVFACEDMISDAFTCVSKSLPVLEILHKMMQNLVAANQSSDVTQSESSLAFEKTVDDLTGQYLSCIRDTDKKNFLPWAVTMLDPRFKRMVVDESDVFKWVDSELQSMMKPKETSSVEGDTQITEVSQPAPKPGEADSNNFNLLWSSFDKSIKKYTLDEPVNELQRYVEEFVISRQEDPFQWWKERSHLYPKLSNIVKQFLCVPATRGQAREFFLEKEKMRNSLRDFLEEPQIDAILFLNSRQRQQSKEATH